MPNAVKKETLVLSEGIIYEHFGGRPFKMLSKPLSLLIFVSLVMWLVKQK